MSTPAFHPHVPLKTDLQQNEYKVWQPTDDTTAAVMMTLAQSLLTHREEAEPLPARWAQRAWKKHQRCSCNHHKTFTGTTLAGVHQSTWSTSCDGCSCCSIILCRQTVDLVWLLLLLLLMHVYIQLNEGWRQQDMIPANVGESKGTWGDQTTLFQFFCNISQIKSDIKYCINKNAFIIKNTKTYVGH